MKVITNKLEITLLYLTGIVMMVAPTLFVFDFIKLLH